MEHYATVANEIIKNWFPSLCIIGIGSGITIGFIASFAGYLFKKVQSILS